MALDMEAVIRDVVDAGLNVEAAFGWDDAWEQIKSKLGLAKQPPPTGDHLDMMMRNIEKTISVTQGAAGKTEIKGEKSIQEGLAAPWKELRKRFPKK